MIRRSRVVLNAIALGLGLYLSALPAQAAIIAMCIRAVRPAFFGP